MAARDGTGRIIDANLNRAREAARVVEEHVRFVLNDVELTRRLKDVRHRLRGMADTLGGDTLLAERDTSGDVGTRITTAAELRRESPGAVASAALKRLQEALRVLEEYGKLRSPAAAAEAEALRYQAYGVESELHAPRHRLRAARLCVIVTASLCRGREIAEVTRDAIRGGADVIQLREKTTETRPLFDVAIRLRAVTRDEGALYIINDRADIAAAAEADGVHLGQTDLPLSAARGILGFRAIIGCSSHSVEQAQRAADEGADYIGVGTVFPSKTKRRETIEGPGVVRHVVREVDVPAFAIGGINAENVEQVVVAGCCRVAVCSAVIGSDDVEGAVRALCSKLIERDD
jgi:thiamine-phosphate pyrophosphorylase